MPFSGAESPCEQRKLSPGISPSGDKFEPSRALLSGYQFPSPGRLWSALPKPGRSGPRRSADTGSARVGKGCIIDGLKYKSVCNTDSFHINTQRGATTIVFPVQNRCRLTLHLSKRCSKNTPLPLRQMRLFLHLPRSGLGCKPSLLFCYGLDSFFFQHQIILCCFQFQL